MINELIAGLMGEATVVEIMIKQMAHLKIEEREDPLKQICRGQAKVIEKLAEALKNMDNMVKEQQTLITNQAKMIDDVSKFSKAFTDLIGEAYMKVGEN
jgi:hypothetical protein